VPLSCSPQPAALDGRASAVLIDLDQEAIRHARHGLFVIRVAPWARHASGSAGTGVRPIPRLAGMGLTDPADVLAEGALRHSSVSSSGRRPDRPSLQRP
jgi:hypothetical protein